MWNSKFIEEQIVNFETAKLAKDKGFNLKEPCTCGGFPNCICDTVKIDNYIYKPTQSLLQKWLREIYNIHIVVYIMENSDGSIYYDFGLKQVINWLTDKSSKPREFLTYEEALEVGLVEALKLI